MNGIVVAGLLRVATANDDRARVRALIAEIVGYLDRSGLDGIEDPGRVYLSLTSGAVLLDDLESAYTHLAAGRNMLQDRAARISDPELRESYLHQVPAHQKLLEFRLPEISRSAR